jgi:hypothetical protein
VRMRVTTLALLTRTQLFEELADHLLAYTAIEAQVATSCAWSVRTAGTGP